MTPSIMAGYVFLSVICAECHNAECHLCCVSFLLTVENFPYVLSVIMLSAIILSVTYAVCHFC